MRLDGLAGGGRLDGGRGNERRRSLRLLDVELHAARTAEAPVAVLGPATVALPQPPRGRDRVRYLGLHCSKPPPCVNNRTEFYRWAAPRLEVSGTPTSRIQFPEATASRSSSVRGRSRKACSVRLAHVVCGPSSGRWSGSMLTVSTKPKLVP